METKTVTSTTFPGNKGRMLTNEIDLPQCPPLHLQSAWWEEKPVVQLGHPRSRRRSKQSPFTCVLLLRRMSGLPNPLNQTTQRIRRTRRIFLPNPYQHALLPPRGRVVSSRCRLVYAQDMNSRIARRLHTPSAGMNSPANRKKTRTKAPPYVSSSSLLANTLAQLSTES